MCHQPQVFPQTTVIHVEAGNHLLAMSFLQPSWVFFQVFPMMATRRLSTNVVTCWRAVIRSCDPAWTNSPWLCLQKRQHRSPTPSDHLTYDPLHVFLEAKTALDLSCCMELVILTLHWFHEFAIEVLLPRCLGQCSSIKVKWVQYRGTCSMGNAVSGSYKGLQLL